MLLGPVNQEPELPLGSGWVQHPGDQLKSMDPNCPVNASNKLVLRWRDALGRFLRWFVELEFACVCYAFVICLGLWLRDFLQSLIIRLCRWSQLRHAETMNFPQTPETEKAFRSRGLLYSFPVICGLEFLRILRQISSNCIPQSLNALRRETFSRALEGSSSSRHF